MNATLIPKKEQVANSTTVQKKNNPFFSPLTIQKKLSIGSANDAYEVEADRMADQVVNMSDSQVQTKLQSGSLIQRKC